MFKARGILELDLSRTVHQVQFENGKLTGDAPLVVAIKVTADKYQQSGHHFSCYMPSGDYIEDVIAICFILHDICEADSLEFTGDIPQLPYEEGLIY